VVKIDMMELAGGVQAMCGEVPAHLRWNDVARSYPSHLVHVQVRSAAARPRGSFDSRRACGLWYFHAV
jgi:hypothetical protein